MDLNIDLVNHVAATIRRVDGGHTMGAGVLAEAIVAGLAELAASDAVLERAATALVDDGREETHEGPLGIGTLSHDDLRSIAATVLRSLIEGEG